MGTQRKIFRLLMPDIFVWAVVLLLPIYFSPTPGHARPETLALVRYLPYILSCLLLVVIYYMNYHVLIPRLYFRRKYFIYALTVVAVMWLLILVPEVDHLFEAPHLGPPHPFGPPGPPTNPASMIVRRAFDFSYFEVQIFTMGLLTLVVSSFLCITRRLRETEDAKLGAELAFLKAQVNPHFLFNTLNSIYSLAYKKSDLTAPAIVKLSGLMRYVISDAQRDMVPLEKELEYVSNYIELQRLRLPENTTLKWNIFGDTSGKLIAPLLFLPFVENAFKYGVNPEKESSVSVEFMITTHTLQMDISNSIVSTPNMPSERIGIGNSKERLEKHYPDHHRLVILHTPEKFTVSLTIDFS